MLAPGGVDEQIEPMDGKIFQMEQFNELPPFCFPFLGVQHHIVARYGGEHDIPFCRRYGHGMLTNMNYFSQNQAIHGFSQAIYLITSDKFMINFTVFSL